MGNDEVIWRWYVARTERAREHTAAAQLIGRRIKVYLPSCPVVRFTRHRRRVVLVPILPGYLFLHLPDDDQQWGRIRNTVGILSGDPILRVNGLYAPIPDRAVEIIHEVETQLVQAAKPKPKPNYRLGQHVIVRTGPTDEYYAELRATIVDISRLDNKGKLLVAGDLLGRLTTIEVAAAQIRAA